MSSQDANAKAETIEPVLNVVMYRKPDGKLAGGVDITIKTADDLDKVMRVLEHAKGIAINNAKKQAIRLGQGLY